MDNKNEVVENLFIYKTCSCGETVSIFYEGELEKCPFCKQPIKQ